MKRRGKLIDAVQLPTEAELEILNILWAAGPSTVRDVHTQSSKDTGYTTVLKHMQVMAEKGLLERSERSRSHVYEPRATKEQTQQGKKARMRCRRLLSLLAVSCIVIAGQAAMGQDAAAATVPEFEAVSIRQSGPQSQRGSEGGPGSKSPTLFRFHKATMQDLIAKGWAVDYFQIASAVPLDKEVFDVDARLPEGVTKEQFRAMLQSMLAARFGLKAHPETREFPAYALVVAKSGLKLKEVVEGEPDVSQGASSGGACGRGRWPDVPPNLSTAAVTESFEAGYELNCLTVQRETFARLVRLLPKQDGLPIVDTTGLAGRYSFHLEYAAALPNAGPDASAIAADVFSALKEQLGLQLQKRKLPFDVVVVESFNRMPTAN